MSKYNLYYTLNTNISNKCYPVSKKKKLIKDIEKITTSEKEALILLIHEHLKNHNEENYDLNIIPYKGEQKGKDVIFDLNNLPNELCWILEKFINVVINRK